MTKISRRSFLAGSAALGASATLPRKVVLDASRASAVSQPVPFHGVHQAGFLSPPAGPSSVAIITFDVVATKRSELTDLMRSITSEARWLVEGGAPPNLGPGEPPDDNGILGPSIGHDQLIFTLGMGATLFDDRFGLKEAKPARLKVMEPFPNDNLDPAFLLGDLSIQLRATNPDTIVHGMRHLMKYTDGAMQARWRIDGSHSPARPSGTPRNYQGFKDGIANPDVAQSDVADKFVWVRSGTPEPAWTEGGTYQVIRIIRMLSEFWDRVSLQEQETMIGRRKDSGAPLDGNNQNDTPDYKADPQGAVIPLAAHIRVANPRTAETESSRIFRVGFNYDRGLDANGNLDQGLIFTCYQQDIERQFAAVQTRLIDEPLVDYISPIGGGYFFVPAGVRDADDFYGRALLA